MPGARKATSKPRAAARAGAKARARHAGNGAGNGSASSIELGPLTGYIGYALRRAQIVAFTDFIASLRQLDLRPAIFGVLMIIDGNPGQPQSAVCSALGIQKANFGPLVQELEKRKLAVRHEGVADRRSYALHLTPGGRELLRRARALHGEHEARLAKRLGSGGREQLLSLLGRLNS
ncbi:MAG TPA: MarR family winged helix-turn-helix transcriptional regulator [Steroidobacteraceae bacterium]|nr:MarR family winged helix-turn-helix transcriptional regulator [Steroidobacteraceae bacterium]